MKTTKDILIQTALKLFAEKGLYGVQAREIAAAANAGPNAITYHFGGISGLIDAVWEYAITHFDYDELENYCRDNLHLLKSIDGKRQFVTEAITILFKLISGGETSRLVNLFLMTASVTAEGQQKIKTGISNGIVEIFMQIYMNVSGNKDIETAFAWTLNIAGGAVLYSVNSDLFASVFANGVIPASSYGRIQYITTRNALFSLGLLPE